MAEYTLSISKFNTLPAWGISADEGESWECGDYICLLQKDPPFMRDAMKQMVNNRPVSAIPSTESYGIRYPFTLALFYKKGRNPSGKDSALPAEIMTIEQINPGFITGETMPWGAPVFCSFQPSGRWNSGRELEAPVTRDSARAIFFEELAKRGLPTPTKLGDLRTGQALLVGKTSPATKGSQRTGCLVPFVLIAGSLFGVLMGVVARHCS